MIDDYPETVEAMARLKYTDDPGRQERALARMIEMERTVEYVIRGIHRADLSDYDQTIVNCRLDGMSITAIAEHLEKNRSMISRQLDDIARQIHAAMKE
ncbi:hypothetical protein [Bhargavaea beijingensis]|uniref:Uncharacterized protein n=1 Tax=Bhargavaea beijingensis TaxID=426756 RepID=A0ABX9ZD25_9BACL|nr:hypothetical protein [Bhargavaea beijingensis]RSK30963.1 hypothetical protein EJA12_09610 [Bhargavaea beijingensis]